jgi:hypothetical protein
VMSLTIGLPMELGSGDPKVRVWSLPLLSLDWWVMGFAAGGVLSPSQ